MQNNVHSLNSSSNMQHEFYNSGTSAMFTAPNVSQTHASLYNHDGQNNNVYSANYCTPINSGSTVSALVPQNFGNEDLSVGFSSNIQHFSYQTVACKCFAFTTDK